MLRLVLSSTAALALCLASLGVTAAEKNATTNDKNATAAKNKKGDHATITKVDAKKGTVTVRMKNKQGKEEERTFKLTEEVRMLDSTGRVAAIDVFQSGDEVLVVEEEGRLREMRQPADKEKSGGTRPNEKSQK